MFKNYTLNWISLKPNTLLTTENWLLFRTKNWIYIPSKNIKWKPWIVYVLVRSEQNDNDWKIIWARWNLKKWEQLYIKKIYASIWQKKIKAIVYKNFKWWETNTRWIVQLKDIKTLKKMLVETIKSNYKSDILKYNLLKKDDHILILDDKFMWYENKQFHIYSNIWEKSAFIKWNISVDVYYHYIKQNKLLDYYKKYLTDRIVSIKEFIWWNKNSIRILEIKNVNNELYLATISINALLWYDFNKDYNNIKWTILSKIKWLSTKYAKNILLWFDEIAAVEIHTTNTLNIISKLNSRIFIIIND